MRQAYIEKTFHAKSLRMIEQANTIIVEYQQQGFTLTLRQLYYQFVSRDLIKNKQTEYKRLGSLINDARLAGLLDWSAIEDRTRNLMGYTTWDSPASIISSCIYRYATDWWQDQDNYCEVWVEKDALMGVIEPVCGRYQMPHFACRGYTSQSEQRAAGQRLANIIDEGKSVTIFHLGDHDPSGIDMTRDNLDRLTMFIEADSDPALFNIQRLALNIDQVRKYSPPPNPAKMTDSRFGGYASLYGQQSWELDALDPKTIDALIEDNVRGLIDFDKWNAAKERQSEGRDKLREIADSMKSD